MNRPVLYVYINDETGIATVRGRDAKAYCQAAQPPAGSPFAWRVTWGGGGWCIPARAIDDLWTHARSLGQVIAVSHNAPRPRGQSRGTGTGTVHPGQETLL